MILLECPVAECTRAQRISHYWSGVLAGSKKLRRHMFLERQTEHEILTDAGTIIKLTQSKDLRQGRIITTVHPALDKLRRPEYMPTTGMYTVFKGVTVTLDKHSFDKWSNGSWEQLPVVQRRSGWTLSYTMSLWSTELNIAAHGVKTLGKLRRAMQNSVVKDTTMMMVTIDGFVEEGSEEVKAARARAYDAAVAAASANKNQESE